MAPTMPADFASAQTDWIAHAVTQAPEFLPEKSRSAWRQIILKIRRQRKVGVQLSMRYINAMGMERPVEANEAAQRAAKELYALYMGFGETLWNMLEVRFVNALKPGSDEHVVTCTVAKDTEPPGTAPTRETPTVQ
jgi:hypothetical protein